MPSAASEYSDLYVQQNYVRELCTLKVKDRNQLFVTVFHKVLGNVRTDQPPRKMSVRSLVPVSVKIFQQNSLSEFHLLSVGFCQYWPASVHSYLSQRHETN